MLAFVLASFVFSAAAAPSPHIEPSAVGASMAAPSVGWWDRHAHTKWRSAWPSHHHSHPHPNAHHHTSASGSSIVITASCSASSAAATNSTVASASPSSTHPSSVTKSTTASASPSSTLESTHATTSAPVPSSSATYYSSKPSQSSSIKPSTTKSVSPTSTSISPSAAAYLNPHNAMRAKHSAQPLTWSEDLANAAHTWASKCQWAHSGGAVGNYGENIAAGTGEYNATSAVAAWASEESQYNPAAPVYSHYTQMVWKATTQLGCSVVSCPGLINSDVAQFHVCEYSVAGNMEGQFSANVS